MKKIVFSLCSLISMYSLATQVSDVTHQSSLQRYNKALLEFEKYVDDIELDVWISYGYRTQTTHYDYLCPSEASLESFENYDDAKRELKWEAGKAVWGYGLLLGVLAKCCERTFGFKDQSVLYLAAIACMGKISLQNRKMGVVPYYDQRLCRCDDMFAQIGSYTFERMCGACICVGIGYVGAQLCAKA